MSLLAEWIFSCSETTKCL